MKNTRYFIPLILLLFVFSCNKDTVERNDKKPADNSMESLNISKDFDWRLTKNRTLNISSEKQTTLNVTSESGDIIYYKGKHDGFNKSESIVFNVPEKVKKLNVNGKLVDVTGKTMDIELGNLKAAGDNRSIVFNGSTYCEIQDISELNNASAFTIEGWVKQSDNTAYARLFHKIAGMNDISVATYNSRLYFEVGNGANTFGYWPDYAATIANDSWFHFAAVFDGSGTTNADKLKLYVNGSPVTLTFNGTIPSTTFNFAPGTYQFLSWDQKLDGKMDEIRVWDHARTQSQINSKKSVELEGNESGLLVYYKFDAFVFGNQVEDATGNHTNALFYAGSILSTDIPFTYMEDADNDGVADGDDDYPNDDTRAYDNYFPAAGFGSLAFEDLWPGKGDYDFNDLVVDYRFKTVTNANNEVVEIYGTFPVKATGAVLHNGFGFTLPNSNTDFVTTPEKLVVTGCDIQESYINLNGYGHESGQSKASIIVFDDVFNLLEHPGQALGINTENWAPHVPYDTVFVKMTPDGTYSASDFSLEDWNPFMIVDQKRGHEVHLPDYEPTDLADINLFNQFDDDSDLPNDRYYKTVKNLPWAIDIPAEFEWPREKIEIVWAYLHFAEWAESSGTLYTNWYEDLMGYRTQSNLYEWVP